MNVNDAIERRMRLGEIKKDLDSSSSISAIADIIDELSAEDARQLLRLYVLEK